MKGTPSKSSDRHLALARCRRTVSLSCVAVATSISPRTVSIVPFEIFFEAMSSGCASRVHHKSSYFVDCTDGKRRRVRLPGVVGEGFQKGDQQDDRRWSGSFADVVPEAGPGDHVGWGVDVPRDHEGLGLGVLRLKRLSNWSGAVVPVARAAKAKVGVGAEDLSQGEIVCVVAIGVAGVG